MGVRHSAYSTLWQLAAHDAAGHYENIVEELLNHISCDMPAEHLADGLCAASTICGLRAAPPRLLEGIRGKSRGESAAARFLSQALGILESGDGELGDLRDLSTL
ncbi:MAG: hypothetical protein ACYTKD_20575 [Planctomycetota bacterium]